MAANGLLFVDIVILERKVFKFLLRHLWWLGPHPGEGLKIFESPLGRAGPRPQSGASFSGFSTVSVSSPVVSSLDGAGPHAAGAALFDEECRSDPAFRSRVLGLERMLRVHAEDWSPLPRSLVLVSPCLLIGWKALAWCHVRRSGPRTLSWMALVRRHVRFLGRTISWYSENDLVDDAESVLEA